MRSIDGFIVMVVRPEFPSEDGKTPTLRRRYFSGTKLSGSFWTTGEPDSAIQFVTVKDAERAVARYSKAMGAASAGHTLQILDYIPDHDGELPEHEGVVSYSGREAPRRPFKLAPPKPEEPTHDRRAEDWADLTKGPQPTVTLF